MQTLLAEKTAAVEEARDEAKRKNETRIETLKQEHQQTAEDYTNQVRNSDQNETYSYCL